MSPSGERGKLNLPTAEAAHRPVRGWRREGDIVSQTSTPHARKREDEHVESLRGTLVSVLFLGAFIVACWLGVFYLFLSRQ